MGDVPWWLMDYVTVESVLDGYITLAAGDL